MTRRKTLTNGRRLLRKKIDMEAVYLELDTGKSIKEVAAMFGVTSKTLYRHHEVYQEELKRQEELERQEQLERQEAEPLPPLPDDLLQ